MKKIEKFKIKRYYQRSYGLFVDVERHEYKHETVIRMGSLAHIRETLPMIERIACSRSIFSIGNMWENMSVDEKTVCCTFNAGALSDEECLNSFAKVYWRFASSYIFFRISDKMGVYPFEIPYENDGGSSDSLIMDKFSELEVRRYKHKYGNEKYYLDVEILRNPENPDDVETKMYIMGRPGDTKVLCDIYYYEFPKEKLKKILKDSMYSYRLIYRQAEVYHEYNLSSYAKPDDDWPATPKDDSFNNIPEGLDEELPFN
ncbi:MAG: hypothetical protein NC548_50640 [Lachnospiraceae bacterium]|nr:hypothetical protein [Lachnospiraceae bacterium]